MVSPSYPRTRSGRSRRCRRCGFQGSIDGNGLCRSCQVDLEQRQEDLEQRPGRDEGEKETCKQCRRAVRAEEKGLRCDNCNYWYHASCEGLTAGEYQKQANNPNRLWFCEQCNPLVKNTLQEAKRIKGGYTENPIVKKTMQEAERIKAAYIEMKEDEGSMVETVRELKEVVKEVTAKNKAQEERAVKESNKEKESNLGRGQEESRSMERLEEIFQEKLAKFQDLCEKAEAKFRKFEENWQTLEEGMVDKVADRVLDVIEEEQFDQGRRRNNVVMFNVEEEEGERDGDEKDRQFCEDLFKDTLRLRGVRVESTFRCGGKQNGKIRPLTVRLANSDMKWEVVQKGRELKEHRDLKVSRIGIAPDYARREREKRERLRTEVMR